MANKSAVLSVKIVGDSKNLQSALRRASKSVNDEMGKISNAQAKLSKATNAALRFASSFTKVGMLSSGLLVASANTATLAGSLLSVAGILPVLPGLLGGFAMGAAVTGMALADMGTVLEDLKPAFTNLQDSVSAKFWEQAAQPIRDLVNTTLPALESGMNATAVATGSFFAGLAGSLQNALTPSVMDSLFAPLVDSINIAKEAIDPLVQAFVSLGVVGGQYLPQLAGWFVRISTTFNEFIQGAAADGTLTTWINNGIFAFQELGRIIGGVGSILGGIFSAAQAAGGSTLTSLADGLARIGEIVNAPAFQGALTTLFTSASTAVANLSTGLAPLGDAFVQLAPLLGTILETVGTLAGTALVTLSAMITQNQPLIDNLKTGFEMLGNAIVVVGTFIAEHSTLFTTLAVVIGVVAAAITIASTAMAIFNAVMALNPITIIVLAVIALIAAIVFLATQTTFFQDTWATMTNAASVAWEAFTTWVQNLWDTAVNAVMVAVDTLRSRFDSVISTVRGVWDDGFNFMRDLAQGAIDTVTGAIDGISTAVQSAINWVRDLFSMDGMPGWLSGVLGMGGTGFEINGALTPVPGQMGIGTTGGMSLMTIAGGNTTRTTVVNKTVNVTFSGMVTDRVGTAREIRKLLADEAALVGA